MNPYSPIHIDKLHYTCCICKSTNALPLNYLQGQEQMPPETTLNFSSFLLGRGEPTLAKQVGLLFVIDLTLETKELEAVKKSILEVLNNLEEGRTVGLITYHKYVCLHDLTSKVDSTITFSPNHSFDPLLFSDLLAIPESPGQVNQRYLLPLLSCK
jgi:protein transport protein SEC23